VANPLLAAAHPQVCALAVTCSTTVCPVLSAYAGEGLTVKVHCPYEAIDARTTNNAIRSHLYGGILGLGIRAYRPTGRPIRVNRIGISLVFRFRRWAS
jgi:hypothetical protein